MYSKQEASLIKKKFWTSFGQYMKPLPNADGETINWLNYKTGIRHLYFRMDADTKQASVSIEMKHPDVEMQQKYFVQFVQLKNILIASTGEEWIWEESVTDDDGNTIKRIGIALEQVNVFNTNDWPAIISFLKPRIIALDSFWSTVRYGFE